MSRISGGTLASALLPMTIGLMLGTIGQEAVTSSRDGFEQAADAIRSLAEAKSPTEYLQLQSEMARASFDRAVAESSRLTESLVKLAGEAFQPLSNRATANAERFNTLVA